MNMNIVNHKVHCINDISNAVKLQKTFKLFVSHSKFMLDGIVIFDLR